MADRFYVTDSWNNLPHYTCAACGYDSMLEIRIMDHVASCPATLALTPAPTASPPASSPDSTAPALPPSEPDPEPVAADPAPAPEETH